MLASWEIAPEDEIKTPPVDNYGITVPLLGEYKVTDADFDAKQAAYVEKYGYTVNIPEITDIIKIGWYSEPSEDEVTAYKDGSLKKYDYTRYMEIREKLQEKKAKYTSMLGSPTPSIVRSAGTIMNLLDDVNDTLGTGAVLLRTAGYLGKRYGLKFLMGPAGWFLLAADIFGIAMSLQQASVSAIWKKNAMDDMMSINPFSKKSRARRADKLKRFKLSKGELIEAAQTTNQFVGVGLCLGPIVGLVQDVAFGTWRVAKGEKVNIKAPPGMMKDWRVRAAFGVLNAAHLLFQDPRTFEEEDYYKTMVAVNHATQIAHPFVQEWNPLDNIDGIENMEKEAPGVTRPLTKLATEEVGVDPEPLRNWAIQGSRWATSEQIYEQGIYWASETFEQLCRRNRRSMDALIAAQNAELFSRKIIDSIEGVNTTVREADPTHIFIRDSFAGGFEIPKDITKFQIRRLELLIMFRRRRNLGTNYKQLCYLLKHVIGVKMPFEVPRWWQFVGWHYFAKYPEEFAEYAAWAHIPHEWWGYREREWVKDPEWSYYRFYDMNKLQEQINLEVERQEMEAIRQGFPPPVW